MKEYLQCKVAAWKKKTKNDKDYFALKIEVKEDIIKKMIETKQFHLNANIFLKNKTSEAQPDFATIEKDKA